MKQGINEKLFSRLYEWRLNLKTKTVLGEYLTGTELSLEFPMINDQYTGVHQNYAYAQIVDSVTRSAGTSEKGIAKNKPHCPYINGLEFGCICLVCVYILPYYASDLDFYYILQYSQNMEVLQNYTLKRGTM